MRWRSGMQIENNKEAKASLLNSVGSLRQKAPPEVREQIASNVTNIFNSGIFDQAENEIAFDILRLLAKDMEIKVRKVLSENLKTNTSLPRDIACKLANDVLEVSLPILEFSPVLSDDDIISVIKSAQQVAKLIAITRREQASQAVSAELINTKNEDVVVSLFSNQTAHISQGSMEYAVNTFKSKGSVIGALMNRGGLQADIVEKILGTVSAEIRVELVNKYKINTKTAGALLQSSQKNAANDILNPGAGRFAMKSQSNLHGNSFAQVGAIGIPVEQVVNRLFKDGRLTNSLIMRSLCEGNMLFFEVSLARRTGVPLINIRTLLRDGNIEALKSIWKRAGMPDSIFDAMKIIANYMMFNTKEGIANDNYKNSLLVYIYEKGFDTTAPFMSYIASLITSKVRIQDII